MNLEDVNKLLDAGFSAMEIGSILENIRKLSPAAAEILGKFFDSNHSNNNEGE